MPFVQAGFVTACLICLTLSGCSGGREFVYEPDHELKPGPGLFSGKDGEFTLIGRSEKERQEQEKQEGQ